MQLTGAGGHWLHGCAGGGAPSVQEMQTQFYGDRSGGVEDPCGVTWWISTHVEDVSPEEMARRMKDGQS